MRQGATFTYTLTITNTGPSDASVVTMTDTLPNSITIESIDPGSFDCDQGTARITCTLTTLAADEVDTIVIVATPLESGINITNTATITSTSIDESTDDNTDSVTSEVIAEGDLEISKVADVTEATAGLPLTYTITITNNGPSDITGVALSDTLPTTVTFVSITDTQSICTQGPPINCSFGDLDADATEVITLVVTPNVSGTLQNTAIVTTTDTDPDTTNNTSSATLPVRARADLSISKTAPAELIAGQTIGYTIEVINNGPSTATGVQVIDQVPDGLTIIPGFDVRCGINGSLITCNLDDMIFLETESIQFQAVVASDLVDPAEETVDLINSASVSANEPDDDTTNNDSGPQTTTVRAETDLSVTKVGAPDPVVAGESLDFTITVVNNGPSTATGVSVSDTLPDNVTLDTASAECSGTAPIVCDAGTLAPGENQPFTISVLVDPTTAETVVNQITVSGDQTDPNPDNNTFSSNTSVTVESNVSVTKVADVTTLRLGDEIQYTITIENAGPSAVLNGVLTDPLPSGLVFVLASSGCSNANNTVTCNIDTILPNESASIVITARFSPESGIDTLESLNNVATFTSNIGAILGQGNVLVEVEAIPGNNYLPLIMWQAPKFADLVGSLRLTPAETSFTAGELVQITAVVTNQGEAPASGFWVDLYINPSTPPTTASIITTTLWQNLCTLEPCLVWSGALPRPSIQVRAWN
ncbi:MAG: DUF11 domain-containing protein [Chloroflexaceae bacterium]|nr:DUF11 domain-containing protein [Chloroflexaceae bacterium]